MQNPMFLIRKLISFFILVLYFVLIFFFLSPAIFNDLLVVVALLIFFSYMLIEQIYKIEPPEDYKIERRDILIIVFFFLYPFLLVLSFYEREILILEFFPLWNHEIVKIGSIGVLLSGMIIAFLSRVQLGKYGTTFINVEDDHQLITTGIYKYIRHPIYLGALLQYVSIGIAVGSLIVTSLAFVCWLIMTMDRIGLEERLLTEKFGEEYLEYMKRTKKLISFIY